MFVHYFTHVPLSLSEVENRIDTVRHRMADMAGVAYREGEQLRAKVGPWGGGFAKEVEVEVGTPFVLSTGLAYPVSWVAHGAGTLFPRLTAELVLAQVGKGTTRIALEGTYDPPLGFVGQVVDRALLGRYADATVRNWVDRLAVELLEEGLTAVGG